MKRTVMNDCYLMNQTGIQSNEKQIWRIITHGNKIQINGICYVWILLHQRMTFFKKYKKQLLRQYKNIPDSYPIVIY